MRKKIEAFLDSFRCRCFPLYMRERHAFFRADSYTFVTFYGDKQVYEDKQYLSLIPLLGNYYRYMDGGTGLPMVVAQLNDEEYEALKERALSIGYVEAYLPASLEYGI